MKLGETFAKIGKKTAETLKGKEATIDETIERNRVAGSELYAGLSDVAVKAQGKDCAMDEETQLRFSREVSAAAEAFGQMPPIKEDMRPLDDALKSLTPILEEMTKYACNERMLEVSFTLLRDGVRVRKEGKAPQKRVLQRFETGTGILQIYLTIERIEVNNLLLSREIGDHKGRSDEAVERLRANLPGTDLSVLTGVIASEGAAVNALTAKQSSNQQMIINHQNKITQLVLSFTTDNGNYDEIEEQIASLLEDAQRHDAEFNAILRQDTQQSQMIQERVIASTEETNAIIGEAHDRLDISAYLQQYDREHAQPQTEAPAPARENRSDAKLELE